MVPNQKQQTKFKQLSKAVVISLLKFYIYLYKNRKYISVIIMLKIEV